MTFTEEIVDDTLVDLREKMIAAIEQAKADGRDSVKITLTWENKK